MAPLLVPDRILEAAGTTAPPARVTKDGDDWEVRTGDELVIVDDVSGEVVERWRGVQAEWQMARGHPGAFGRRAASLPVWIGLLVLFLLPFARPPWRMLHLDLLVLASFSVSLACFSDGNVDASVPLAYPPLLYLLGRFLFLARRRGPPQSLRLVGAPLLLAGIVFLVGFRIALQAISSNVIDVGYAGVIGADLLAHGEAIYGNFPADNPRGDTYGPLVYLAYLPFELALPWSGTWDDLPAAHVAATAFDLACAYGLYRLRGPLLAYLWLAFPFTLFAANSGANDALTGLLVLAAVATRSGALGAAAALTKFAPLVLLPLLRLRGAVVVFALAVAALLATGQLDDFWDRAVRFQAERDSPFSVWGLYDLPGRLIAQLLVAGLAIAVARRGGDRFALAAALLVAVQLTAGHWFYLYLVWFLPVGLVALLAPYDVSGRSTGSIDSARPSDARTTTAISHGSSSAVP